MELTHENRLVVLTTIGRSIREGCLDPVLDPYTDGRCPEGDARSPALRAAINGLLAEVDRVERQASADLADWRSAVRAETRNRERHERAERGHE